MKKLRLRQNVKDALAVALFMVMIILGVIAINARFEYLINEGIVETYE